jgi:uncharacterized membrane protein (UPF0127 family)
VSVIHYVRSLIENFHGIRQPVGVNMKRILLPLLVVTLLTGCGKSDTNRMPVNSDYPPFSLPAQAQPKLRTMKIYLGAETLNAELALTPREQQTGMMFRTNVTDESAMLFVLPQAMHAPDGFWMTNCPVSLSAAYIGPDGVIEEIHHLEKNDNVSVVATNDNILFVLEVNDGWFQRHHISTGTVIRTEKGSLAETFSNRQ